VPDAEERREPFESIPARTMPDLHQRALIGRNFDINRDEFCDEFGQIA